MKFLTEDDLRVEYHKVPFDTFTIQKNTRLTPGARTFLADRKVRIIDESERTRQKANRAVTGLKEEGSNEKSIQAAITHQAEWLAIRCELLKTAQDLASIKLPLAEELKIIEHYLALAVTDQKDNLPPITIVDTDPVQVDKATLIGNLSTVGMFLQTNKGQVLTRLYPLYFRLDAWIEQLDTIAPTYLLEVLHRLEQLIMHYLIRNKN